MWEYNYICHHGIKGQKWGVRRYQNKDGTLTPAGRRRQARLQSELDALGPRKPSEPKSSELTNEELKEKTERLRLENDYNQKLQDSKKFVPDSKQMSAGRDWVKTFDNMGKIASSISTFTTQGIQVYNNYARIMNSLTGSNKKYISGLPNNKEIKAHNEKKDD